MSGGEEFHKLICLMGLFDIWWQRVPLIDVPGLEWECLMSDGKDFHRLMCRYGDCLMLGDTDSMN